MKILSSERRSIRCPLLQLLTVMTGLFTIVSGASYKVEAQITTSITPTTGIDSLGTLVSLPADNVYTITGGTRPENGTNLFHSFGEFSVGSLDTARFLNTTPELATSNILGRVTGGNLSNIFGTIETTGFGNANLFLMNPAGFLFGPNATVNVGGMMAFTSSDYLKLAGDARFNAIPDAAADALLTALPVAAFGFLGSNPGAITVQGSQFTETARSGISLVGGNIEVTAGTLDDGTTVQPARLAPGGQISLASVTSPGEILATNFQPEPGMTRGTINLSQGSTLDVSANTAGTVRIRSGSFVMDNAVISADTVNANSAPVAIDINITDNVSISTTDVPALTARTTGTGNAGEIAISSGSIDVTATTVNSFLFSAIDTHTSNSGNAGNVAINTGDLTVAGDPFSGGTLFIESGTSGTNPGLGGDVTISAGSIELFDTLISTGNLSAFFLDEGGAGTAGNVTITADRLQMTVSQIVTDSFYFVEEIGRAGDITVAAPNITLDNSSFSSAGQESGGAITINTDHLFAVDSQIVAQTNLTPGGAVTVTGQVIELATGSSIVSSTGGDGDAGSISITATDRLGLLQATPLDRPSGIFSNSDGTFGSLGNSGDIVITTPRLEMTGGARINTSTATSGRGGNVIINAPDLISMSGETGDQFPEPLFSLGTIRPSGIFTLTIGGNCIGSCGSAGNVSVTTGSLTMGTGSQINSGTSSSGQGGNITITTTDTIAMSGILSTGQAGGIQSRTIGTDPDAGAGGNIAITAGQSITISNGAAVSASSTGPGNAGNVTIQGLASPAQSVLIDGSGSGMFTDTQGTGAGGNILVNANSVTLQNNGVLSATTSGTASSATGGTITVTATNQATMTSGSSISSSSTGTGDAGNIEINAGNQFTMTNSSVTTQADEASGGNITITTNPGGTLQLTNSTISTSVLGGSGSGGNITIDPLYVILQNNSQILATAIQGQGGAILITITDGGLFLADATSTISASSQFGVNGTITIQSPNAPVSGQIQPLGKTPLIATSLLNQHCAALAGGQFSSFTVAGRESLPTEPGGWLTSPLYAAGVGEWQVVSGEWREGMSASAGQVARGESLSSLSGSSGVFRASNQRNETNQINQMDQIVLSLRQIAPAGFLTQAFAVDEPAGCQS